MPGFFRKSRSASKKKVAIPPIVSNWVRQILQSTQTPEGPPKPSHFVASVIADLYESQKFLLQELTSVSPLKDLPLPFFPPILTSTEDLDAKAQNRANALDIQKGTPAFVEMKDSLFSSSSHYQCEHHQTVEENKEVEAGLAKLEEQSRKNRLRLKAIQNNFHILDVVATAIQQLIQHPDKTAQFLEQTKDITFSPKTRFIEDFIQNIKAKSQSPSFKDDAAQILKWILNKKFYLNQAAEKILQDAKSQSAREASEWKDIHQPVMKVGETPSQTDEKYAIPTSTAVEIKEYNWKNVIDFWSLIPSIVKNLEANLALFRTIAFEANPTWRTYRDAPRSSRNIWLLVSNLWTRRAPEEELKRGIRFSKATTAAEQVQRHLNIYHGKKTVSFAAVLKVGEMLLHLSSRSTLFSYVKQAAQVRVLEDALISNFQVQASSARNLKGAKEVKDSAAFAQSFATRERRHRQLQRQLQTNKDELDNIKSKGRFSSLRYLPSLPTSTDPLVIAYPNMPIKPSEEEEKKQLHYALPPIIFDCVTSMGYLDDRFVMMDGLAEHIPLSGNDDTDVILGGITKGTRFKGERMQDGTTVVFMVRIPDEAIFKGVITANLTKITLERLTRDAVIQKMRKKHGDPVYFKSMPDPSSEYKRGPAETDPAVSSFPAVRAPLNQKNMSLVVAETAEPVEKPKADDRKNEEARKNVYVNIPPHVKLLFGRRPSSESPSPAITDTSPSGKRPTPPSSSRAITKELPGRRPSSPHSQKLESDSEQSPPLSSPEPTSEKISFSNLGTIPPKFNVHGGKTATIWHPHTNGTKTMEQQKTALTRSQSLTST